MRAVSFLSEWEVHVFSMLNIHNSRLERRRDTRCDPRPGRHLRGWGRRGEGRGGGWVACERRAVTRRWSTAKWARASSSIPILLEKITGRCTIDNAIVRRSWWSSSMDALANLKKILWFPLDFVNGRENRVRWVSGQKERERDISFFEDKMRACAIWGPLLLVGSCVVLADPEADPSEELFNRLQQPKNRNEDKCYDENGRPQVSTFCLY